MTIASLQADPDQPKDDESVEPDKYEGDDVDQDEQATNDA